MMKRKIGLIPAVFLTLSLTLAACGGVPQSDYDAAAAERDALKAQLEAAQSPAGAETEPDTVTTAVGGSFSATVRAVLPDYVLDATTPRAAVVTLFQSGPFVLSAGELAGELRVGETYVFTVESADKVEMSQTEYRSGPPPVEEAILRYNLRLTAVRVAGEGERGMAPDTLTFDYQPPAEPAPAPEPKEPPASAAPEAPALVPVDELSETVRSDLARFRQVEKEDLSDPFYRYLYVTDENGAPVPNLIAFTEGNWYEYLADGGSKVNGVSRNSGLVPFFLYEDTPATLYLVNTQSGGFPYPLQKIELTQPMLDALWEENAIEVVWDQMTPRQSTEAGGGMATVTVRDQSGTPLPDMLVTFRVAPNVIEGVGIPDRLTEEPPVAPMSGGGLIPTVGGGGTNEPRYTDKDGVARFSVEKVFGWNPEGRWTIDVQSGFTIGTYEKVVTVEIGENGPWEFEVTLDRKADL